MTDGKHTLGPWRVSYERGTTQIRTADNESIMCNECYYPWVPDNPADWDLIAAAPDMFDDHKENARILGFLVNELQGIIPAGKLEALHKCRDRSQAAIAKAQGEE